MAEQTTLRAAIEAIRDQHLAHYSMVNAALLKEMLTAALALPDAGEDKLTLPAPTFFIPKRVCEGAPTRDGMCDRCGIENASKASINDPRCLSFKATPADTPPPSQPSLTREDFTDLENACRHLSEKFAGTTGEKPWRAVRLAHQITHAMGWNHGHVETFWDGARLLVGFRCVCGQLQGVSDTGIRRAEALKG